MVALHLAGAETGQRKTNMLTGGIILALMSVPVIVFSLRRRSACRA